MAVKGLIAGFLNRINPRKAVQVLSLAIIVIATVQLYLFVNGIRQDGTASAFTYRPAVLEGFLPIGALMAAKYWFATGIYDPVHPAGLTILLTALIVSLIFRRSFCSWFCPIGTVSEWLGLLGDRLFTKKDRRLPAALHYLLLSLKYLLLGFILYYFVIQVPVEFISQFMNGSYYLVADIQILDFWRNISVAVLIFLAVMTVLSIVFKNFWCRYLCPYGALLSLAGLLSPLGIVRNKENCTNCGSCSKSCPNNIGVAQMSRVNSPECTACLSCTSACPREKTLNAKWFTLTLSPQVLAATVLALYFGIVLFAGLTGSWQSTLTFNDYVQLLGPVKTGP